LTGQSLDHEKPSCELPGAVAPVSATTNWWKAKNFSFSFDFFQNQVTLDCDLQAPSQKNDERLAGQVAHPGVSTVMHGGHGSAPGAQNNGIDRETAFRAAKLRLAEESEKRFWTADERG
jgi:hypothetical protein